MAWIEPGVQKSKKDMISTYYYYYPWQIDIVKVNTQYKYMLKENIYRIDSFKCFRIYQCLYFDICNYSISRKRQSGVGTFP